MQRDTLHTRSTSSIPALHRLKKSSRAPTVELKQMDEGYESMPLLKQDGSLVDRILDIDGGEAISSDDQLEIEAPVGLGLGKWNEVSELVDRIEMAASLAPKIGVHTSDVELKPSELPNLTDTRPKWSFLPIIERLMGDKKVKREVGMPVSPSVARRKNVATGLQSRALFRRASKVSEESIQFIVPTETLEQERINTSEDPPNFHTEEEEIISIANAKLFASKYRESAKQVGTGGHSTVRLATRISDGKVVVCKFMQHTSVWNWYYSQATGRKIPLEIHLLRKFTETYKNPNIINYIEHFEMSGKYVIIMEYMGDDWVDLYDYIEMYGPVVEDDARDIFGSILDTVEFMHKLGYTHNDIKDENILINPKTRQIKLIDFGSTTQYLPGRQFSLFYGTKKFASPEAVGGEAYDPSAQEVWCLGTLLYVLLFKMDPFKDDGEIVNLEISARIARLRASGRLNGGADISDAAVVALTRMMDKDHTTRISSSDILKLAFFARKS